MAPAPTVDLSPITQQLARLEAGQAGQVKVGRRVEEAQRSVEILRVPAEARATREEALELAVRQAAAVGVGCGKVGRAIKILQMGGSSTIGRSASLGRGR